MKTDPYAPVGIKRKKKHPISKPEIKPNPRGESGTIECPISKPTEQTKGVSI